MVRPLWGQLTYPANFLDASQARGGASNKSELMAHQTKRYLGNIILTFTLLAGLADPTMENIPFTQQSGGGTNIPCPGPYTGYSRMTNSAGSIWLAPPTNTTSGTFTNASGFAPPYVSVACAVRKSDGMSWCGTNSVTFPATNSTSYQLVIYVKSTPPPPTNGQPTTLQIIWQ
jgi:hypothetical protein